MPVALRHVRQRDDVVHRAQHCAKPLPCSMNTSILIGCTRDADSIVQVWLERIQAGLGKISRGVCGRCVAAWGVWKREEQVKMLAVSLIGSVRQWVGLRWQGAGGR